MKWMLAKVTRYSPLITLIFLVLAISQFADRFGATIASLAHVASEGSWLYLAIAVSAWLIALIGTLWVLGAWPRVLSNRWIMDILDRLTNKDVLQQLAASDGKPVLIDADDLAQRLKAKVVGQDAVCRDVAVQIRRRLALNLRGRPVGVFLFAGPPGTGKTYLGKRLAVEMALPLLHLDMSQFSTPHAATQIFGSPKGYVGSDVYGKLTATLKAKPQTVVILDEFEKAHDEVHKKFLTAWNDGFITEASDGRQISTTRAIFIATTNAATDALSEVAKKFAQEPDEMRRSFVDVLRAARFAPEVLNRIDRIFFFNPILGLDVARIAALEIEAMINGYGLQIAEGGIDPQLLFDIMERQGRMGDSGSSRDLVRAVEESISDSLIDAKQNNVERISLIAEAGKILAVPA